MFSPRMGKYVRISLFHTFPSPHTGPGDRSSSQSSCKKPSSLLPEQKNQNVIVAIMLEWYVSYVSPVIYILFGWRLKFWDIATLLSFMVVMFAFVWDVGLTGDGLRAGSAAVQHGSRGSAENMADTAETPKDWADVAHWLGRWSQVVAHRGTVPDKDTLLTHTALNPE